MYTRDTLGVGVQEKRKRRRKIIILFSIFFGLYAVILGGSWIIIRSTVFRIQHTTVTGNDQTSDQDIVDALRARALVGGWGPMKALLSFRNMLAWPDKLDATGLALLPAVKSVTVEKDYGTRSLNIKVEERKPYGIWCVGTPGGDVIEPDQVPGECAWFDDGGVVFQKAVGAEGSLIFAVHDYSQHKLNLGAKVLPEEFLSGLFSIFQVLKKSDVNTQEVRLNDLALEELEVRTYNGPKLYFSLRFPADNDLVALNDLSAKPGFAKLQYLDFRVENRVYYK